MREGHFTVMAEVPVPKIAPGKYDCQAKLIDEFGRKFAFRIAR